MFLIRNTDDIQILIQNKNLKLDTSLTAEVGKYQPRVYSQSPGDSLFVKQLQLTVL